MNYKLVAIIVCCLQASSLAETIKLPVTRDNSIVMLEGEWSANAGKSARMRIKGNQHIVVMDFDVSSIRGRLIKNAELVAYASSEEIAGVTLSTIASPWDEYKSNGLSAGIDGIEGWGYAQGRFPAVSGGNSFTLLHHLESKARDGMYHWAVPSEMVMAMATGVSYGLAIHEHDANYGRNPSIYSREQSGKQPYLLIELAEGTDDAPQPPTNLQVSDIDRDYAWLTFDAPASGFAYEVKVDDLALARHNIPLVAPKTRQSIPIRDLPAALRKVGDHKIEVVTLNRTGQRSKPVSVTWKPASPKALSLPEIQWPANGRLVSNFAAIPIADKYDSEGKAVGQLPADYRTKNSLFNGERIRLTAVAGEVISFQALVRGKGDAEVTCTLEGSPLRIDMYQALYVTTGNRRIPDPLLPLPKTISLSETSDQSVFIDIFVPFDAPAGKRSGRVKISDGREVPIDLTILGVQLPKKAAFLCEMNSYGLPDHVDDYYALQQVAYDHRVHANILHYSHNSAAPGSRKSNLDMRLRSGRRMNNSRYDSIEPGAKQGYWDDFAEAFGPYLDGTCFQNGHRGIIPAPGFYLTFHESWPLNCRSYFNGDPDAYRAFKDSPIYAQTYENVLTDFARLAEQKGWKETGFQVYFNNKGSLNDQKKAPWILDEPSSFWDYRALQYYGELTDRGRAPVSQARIDYRIDISRPEYCRGQLDGRNDLWVVSSHAFQHYRRIVLDRQRKDGLKVWIYGTSNAVDESNRQILAWALDSWQYGAEGIVPWQTVDKTGKALKQADQLGLFIYDHDEAGKTVIRHSVRLKAYRDAEQLIALLKLVKDRYQLSTGQMQEFLQHYVPLTGSVRKVNDDDAGTSQYQPAQTLAIDKIRYAALELLSK